MNVTLIRMYKVIFTAMIQNVRDVVLVIVANQKCSMHAHELFGKQTMKMKP